MRALAIFPRDRQLRVIDVDEPSLKSPTDVLVRIREVGVCGTDREIARFVYGEPPADSSYLGHESLGDVVAVGSSVSTVRPGESVVITVRRPCGLAECVACAMGRQDFCTTGRFRECGIKEAHGFMTELVAADERYVVPVPDCLRDVAVLVEPLSIAAKAAEAIDAVRAQLPWESLRQRALVLGAGPVGILAAMMLVTRDFKTTIYSRERVDDPRVALVRSIGAEYISAAEVTPRSLSPDWNVIFEAVGNSRVAFDGLCALAPNGVFVFSGVPPLGPRIEIDADRIMRNLVLSNHFVVGTVNASRSAYASAARLLEMFMTRFPAAVRGLITDRHPLEAAPDVVARQRGIKQVIVVPG